MQLQKQHSEQTFSSRPDVGEEIQEWLTTEEAALYLKITPATLRNMVWEQAIPYYKLGRRNRFLKSELFQFLSKTRKEALWE